MATGADSDRSGVLVWDGLTRPEVIVTGNVDVVVENSRDGRVAALSEASSDRLLDRGAPVVTRDGNLIRVQGPTSIVSNSSVHLALPPNASLRRPGSDQPDADLREGGKTTVYGDLAGVEVGTNGDLTVHGTVGRAAVAAKSWGHVQIANVEGDAAITTPGSVDLWRVTGEGAVTTRYGDIAVGWVGGDLTTAAQSGRTTVDAVRGKAELSSAGGGNISVGSVNPRFAHTLSSEGTTTIEHRSRHRVQNDPGRQALRGLAGRPSETDLASSASMAAAMGNEGSGLATWIRDHPDNTPASRRPTALDTAQIVLTGSPGIGSVADNRPGPPLAAGAAAAAALVSLSVEWGVDRFGLNFSTVSPPGQIEDVKRTAAAALSPGESSTANGVSLNETPGTAGADLMITQDYGYTESGPGIRSNRAAAQDPGVEAPRPAGGPNPGPRAEGGRKA